MRHSTSRTAADRHGNGMGRATLDEIDDTKLMQEISMSGFSDEQHKKIERFVQYGFTSVPQKPSGKGMMKRAAEAIMSFMGSSRSHGIAVMVGDRRFRLYKLEAGEVALHDDQGQQVHFKRDGIWASVPNSKQIIMQIMDDDQMPQDNSGSASQGTDGGSQQKQGQVKQAGRPAQIKLTITKDKFQLDHPNGEVIFNAKKVTHNVSEYFATNGETRLGSDTATNPVYGVSGGSGLTTPASGSHAVLVNADQPGPPTSLDTQK